jgi:hypothetical protein
MSTSLLGLPTLSGQDWIDNYQLPSDIEAPLASARPDQTTTPAGTPTAGQYTLPQSLTDLPGPLQAASTSTSAPGTAGAIASVVTGLDTTPGGTQRALSDYVAIGIGGILVAGGIFFFKQTQNIIVSGGRAVARVGALAS